MAKRDGEHLPSIVNGELVRCSVSQTKTFLLCRRAWFYDKKEKRPRKPAGKGAKLGTECHDQIEHYAKTGEDVRGKIARVGAKYLDPYVPRFPFMGGDILVEAPLAGPTLFTPRGIEIVGFTDLFVPDPTLPELIDHKFRKNISPFSEGGYAENEDELRVDTQAAVYAEWARRRIPSATAIRFTHHNHQTEGKVYATRVSVVLPLTSVVEQWHKTEQLIDGPMRETARLTNPLHVPPTESSCRSFGGCSFEQVCPNSPRNKYAARFTRMQKETPEMGLLDRMKNKTGGDAAPPPPPVANAAPPPAAASPASSPSAPPGSVAAGTIPATKTNVTYKLPDGRLGKFQAAAGGFAYFLGEANAAIKVNATDFVVEQNAAAATPTGTPTPAIAATTPGLVYLVDNQRATFSRIHEGNVYFALVSNPAHLLAKTPGETVLATGETASAPVLPPDAPASNPAPSASSPAAETASTGEPPKARRGRPPKDKSTQTATETGSLVLLVNTRANFETRDLNEFVGDLARQLAADQNEIDIRCAANDSPLAFGKWKGYLAALATNAENMPSGFCSIDRSELTEPVIEALRGMPGVRVVSGS